MTLTSTIPTPRLHLDMDGVVADWRAYVAQVIGYDLTDARAHYPDSDWDLIRSHDRIFRDLPKTGQADQLVNEARLWRDRLGYDLLFLTAIPRDNEFPWTFWDKFTWAQRYYPDIPVWFGPYSRDKQLRSGVDQILVDDRTDNCQSWRERGGIAILVETPSEVEPAIRELESLRAEREAQKNR